MYTYTEQGIDINHVIKLCETKTGQVPTGLPFFAAYFCPDLVELVHNFQKFYTKKQNYKFT